MYTKLQAWSKHHNRDVLHLGVAAMDAFLRQVLKHFFLFPSLFFLVCFRDLKDANTVVVVDHF